MGKRVHVIKKHATYGTYEAFNWKFEEFHSLLDMLGCDVYGEDDSENFECEGNYYKSAMNILKMYKKKGACKKVENMLDNVYSSIEKLNIVLENLGGLDYVLESMELFWKQRDKKSNWISFSAW